MSPTLLSLPVVLGLLGGVWLVQRAGRERIVARERNRIARALHDSLLQNLQSAAYRLNAAMLDVPAESRLRSELDSVLQQTRQAIVEGRDQVLALRQEPPCALELAVVATARQMAEMAPAVQFRLTVDGKRMALLPALEREAGAIAAEALRNAFCHARGSRVEAFIEYGARQFTLRVQDNGSGIVPHLVGPAEAARHWGLTGMRERAEQAGAELRLQTAAGQGTTVELSVAARHAYAGMLRSWLQRQLRA